MLRRRSEESVSDTWQRRPRWQVAKCKVSCSRLSLAPSFGKPHWVNTLREMHLRLFCNQPIFQLCIFREGLSSNYKKNKKRWLTVSECGVQRDRRFWPKISDPIFLSKVSATQAFLNTKDKFLRPRPHWSSDCRIKNHVVSIEKRKKLHWLCLVLKPTICIRRSKLKRWWLFPAGLRPSLCWMHSWLCGDEEEGGKKHIWP
jgi:hypothetical protein